MLKSRVRTRRADHGLIVQHNSKDLWVTLSNCSFMPCSIQLKFYWLMPPGVGAVVHCAWSSLTDPGLVVPSTSIHRSQKNCGIIGELREIAQ